MKQQLFFEAPITIIPNKMFWFRFRPFGQPNDSLRRPGRVK